MNKLSETEALVTSMKADLARLQPELEAKAAATADLLVKVRSQLPCRPRLTAAGQMCVLQQRPREYRRRVASVEGLFLRTCRPSLPTANLSILICEALLRQLLAPYLQVSADQQEAEKVKVVVAAEEKEIGVMQQHTQAMAEEAKADLAEAMPALQAAIDSLKALNKNDIVEVCHPEDNVAAAARWAGQHAVSLPHSLERHFARSLKWRLV